MWGFSLPGARFVQQGGVPICLGKRRLPLKICINARILVKISEAAAVESGPYHLQKLGVLPDVGKPCALFEGVFDVDSGDAQVSRPQHVLDDLCGCCRISQLRCPPKQECSRDPQ